MSDQEAASEAARLTTVQILGVLATLTGLLIALTAPDDGPSFVIVRSQWWWPEVFGAILVTSGLVQVITVHLGRAKIAAWACFVSMSWYASFGVVFALTWTMWQIGHQVGEEPSLYPTVVYWGLGSLHFIQGATILRKYHFGKSDRKGR